MTRALSFATLAIAMAASAPKIPTLLIAAGSARDATVVDAIAFYGV